MKNKENGVSVMKRLFILFIVPLLVFTMIPFQVKADDKRTIQDEIIYDLLVDRYNNGRQASSDQVDIHDPYTYNGGDIDGITKMIEEIEEGGFTMISLSPVMENAVGGYHGYWVEDFYEVEDEFGSMEDIHTLVEKAHDLSMKIMLEIPLNYVAKSSPLVEEHPDWFKEVEVTPAYEATEWLEEVVAFDQSNEEVQAYLQDVALFWMEEAKIDGFQFAHADETDGDLLETIAFELKKKDPNFYLIATTLQNDGDVTHLLENEHLDAVANQEFYTAANEVFTKPDEPVSKVFEETSLTDDIRDLLYVDNLNTPRFSNNFGDNGRNRVTTWQIALAYLYLTPGVPIVYQGSEVPMYGPGYPENQYFVDYSSADPDVKDVFSQMAAMREQYKQFTHGDIEHVTSEQGMSLFKRTYDDRSIYVAINNDSESHTVTIDEVDEEFQLRGLIHDDTIRANDEGEFLIGMERESAEVFIIEGRKGFNWAFIGFVAGVFIVFVGAIIMLSIKQKKREKQAGK